MRLSHILAVLVLLPTFALAQIPPPREKKVEEPKGLLEVPIVFVYDVNGRVSFSGGRDYEICINEQLLNARNSRTKLANDLKEKKHLNKVVFRWFGKETLERLNLMIGDKVPVSIAQAVIATYAKDSKIPVYMEVMTENESLGRKQAVYVGGFVDEGQGPLTSDQIEKLLKPGLTAEELHKLISKFGN